VLERLNRRLPMLTGGARNVPERQRTLRSTIAWSEELLEPPHRAVFARLSVLLGDWTLEAAEAVANPGSEAGVETFDALEALHDHALVRPREDGEGGPWFSMLETIREYALERLASSGEEDVVRRRHAAHFLELAEAGERELTGARTVEWRRRLDREHPNLRAAVEWSLESGDAETGLRISAALWRLWQLRGTLREGVEVMKGLLQLPGSRPRTAIRAKALIAAGSIAYWAGDLASARERYEEALSISRDLGDEVGIAHALYNVAFTHALFDEHGLARATFEDAQRRFEVLDDPLMTAHAKLARAMVALRAPDQGDPEPLAAEALRVFEELGAPHSITLAHGILAQIAFVRGDEAPMIRHTLRSLEVSQAVDDPLGTAVQLDVVAAVLGRRGHHERALRLAGASRRIKDDAGGEAPRALIEVEDARTLAAGALSEEQIRALLEEGGQIGAEDAAELARRELEALAPG
ncbi:MAG TPA: tetratricopeptide repeat protein, partial [Actinomycetota bacterium]|nr:tetratricopeptide repeat protein [Actinomycetota bacterium]